MHVVSGLLRPAVAERSIPEVVSTDEGLETCPEICAPVVLPELDGLVYRAMTVAEIGREGGAKVDVEALLGAKTEWKVRQTSVRPATWEEGLTSLSHVRSSGCPRGRCR